MLRKENYLYGADDVTVPVVANFGDFFIKSLLSHGDGVAFINAVTDSRLTFKEIAQQGMNLAVSLHHMGVRKGDTIAVCSENRYEYWGALLGVVCSGAVFTPYNPAYSAAEMKHILSISKPKHIICSPLAFEVHEKIFRSSVKTIILFGDNKLNNTISFNELITPVISNEKAVIVNNRLTRNVGFEEFLTVEVDKNDVVFMLYSSGTTGMPKGVMLSHANVLTTCCGKVVKYPGSRILTITPWFHAMGLNGSLIGTSSGKCFIFLPKFEVELYLKTIEKYKIDQLLTVPPVLVAISKTQTKYDLSSVRRVTCGAAPLSKDTGDLQEKFPNAHGVIQGYGCTEATIAITVDEFVNGRLVKPGSIGRVIPCTTVKVVDIQTRKVLGPNQEGEICVKGAMIMNGYVGKDRREDFDEEGFFKTGDIGYHEDGYLFIVDRLKELIKYNTYQVAPAEIEAVLLQHPAVRDAGVVGIPNKSAGEVPLAFVVVQPGKTVTQKELQEFVAGKLSNPKRLRGGVRFIEEIPKNASGKILRKDLKVLARSGRSKL